MPPIRNTSLARLFSTPQEVRSEIVRRAFAGFGSRYSTAIAPAVQTSLRTAPPRSQTRHLRLQSTVADEALPAHRAETPAAIAPRSRSHILLRVLATSALGIVSLVAGFAMAAAPAVETVNGFVSPPTDEETLSLYIPATPIAAEVNDRIVNHPLAQRLRQEATMTESRPHLKIPPSMRSHNLTAGTLLGPGMIEVPPLSFNEKTTELPKMVQLSYLGQGLCGHPGIVHGGLLATMLDEGLARCCFAALPNKVGVTASLKIDYRQPCPGDSYVVFKAETTKVEGRKAWAKGWIELLGEEDGTGVKLVEAEALFIEPKNAKNMARIYSTT